MSQARRTTWGLALSQPSTRGLTCPRAAAGAVSSSLSDSSLLEEPSPGLWVSLVRAGDDVLAGEFVFPAFQGAGVSARTGGTLADAGVVGVPFLGEAVVLVFIAGFA